MALVSVIIPTYKRHEMLACAVESVISQTYRNWELIVVDDNSPDSSDRRLTASLLNRYREDGRIFYTENNAHLGAPSARNRGISQARGDYVAFLDDDNEWLPSKLEKQLKIFDDSDMANLGVVYCNALYVDRNGSPLHKTNFYNFRGNSLRKFIVRQRGIGSSLLLVRSEVFKSVHGFKDIHSEQDFVFELEILSKGYGFDFCPEVLVKSYIHDDERITTSDNKIKGMQQGIGESERFLSFLSFYEKRKLYSEYHNKCSNVYILRNMRSKAVTAWALSIMYDPLSIYRRKVLLNILFGRKIAESIQKRIVRGRTRANPL